MHLKKIELCGFKSFADKTRLEFEPGITAIIGPNGCGKSNVADAIRWCIGEQSARSLRSNQMMDVIFNGSQSRATTGMAEVSITFDNSQNVLPIDYSEVTVTRRLFRSGESEYFLNKIQCRLKDIRDLFLDTGIGTEGYSIMEQGKVEFVLSAKPEERRELFEEAAGVSKYKARREEALRKLQKVDIDMNRVNDMLTLLKEQTSALDAQARKARQYKKYQQDLKRLETAALVQSISSCQDEIESINTKLNPRIDKSEGLNTSLDKIDAEISQIRLAQTEKDEQYIKLQDELSQIKSSINLADERIQQASARESELKERQVILSSDIETGSLRISQQETELNQIKALCNELQEKVSKLEQEYKEKEDHISEVRAKITNNTKQDDEIKNRLFSFETRKTELHNEQNRLSSFQMRCESQILSYQKELNRVQEQLSPLDEEISQQETEFNQIKTKRDEIQSQEAQLQNSILETESLQKEMQTRATSLKEQIVSIESKIQTLLEWEKKDPNKSAIRAVLGLELPGIRGPVRNIIRSVMGAEAKVSEAFGDKLNYLISDTIETAQKAIDFLHNNNLGRVTFVVVERLPETIHNPVVTQVIGARSLISLIQYDPALDKVMHFLCGQTMVSEQTIYGHAIMRGGGEIHTDNSMVVEEKLSSLNKELKTKQEELGNASEEERNISLKLEQLNNQKKELDAEDQRLNVQVEIQENQLSAKKQDSEYLKKEISIVNQDLENQQQQEQQTQEQLKNTDQQLNNIENEEQALKQSQQNLHAEIEHLRQQENHLVPLLTESKVAWATQANELTGRKREEEKLQESITILNNRLEQFRDELQGNETKILDQITIQKTEAENLKGFHHQQKEVEKQVQISLNQRQEMLSQLNEKTQVLHELRNQSESLKHEIHSMQLEKRSSELRKHNSAQRLEQDHGIQFTDEIKNEFISVTVTEEEIARLKRRIESIGPVNLAAPEEYANLEERYNFVLNQQQDLLKAKEDLHHVISKINHNTRENFKNTFYQVRENFRHIYHQLFEGGEADLVLTDENNLLESGVDIVAQPPGKKLQNIALLSGGEKALTATALLFAFFMVKPSPFCVLDEVDAPLDDANIGRFINMVKSFAEHSQFLLVTHSKRTMEMANILYGITMEELGVSKIISVRLQKEEAAVTAA